MTFKVIPPIDITEAMLTSSSVAEPNTLISEAIAWNAATNYATGVTAIRTTTHRVYERLAPGGVDAATPESDPTKWLDVGPTNRWAMLDLDENSQTEGTSPLTVVITPNERVGAIGFKSVEADTVQITATVAGSPVYDSGVINLLARYTTSWSEYFFGNFVYRMALAVFDIPLFTNAVFTIVFTRASGNVKVGAMAIGVPISIGQSQYGAEDESVSFSKISRDEFGNATLLRRKRVPKATITTWLAHVEVDKVRKIRDDLDATPAFWCAVDDPTSPYFQSMAILGIYERFTVQLTGPRHSLCTIELEGL